MEPRAAGGAVAEVVESVVVDDTVLVVGHRDVRGGHGGRTQEYPMLVGGGKGGCGALLDVSCGVPVLIGR